MAKAGHRSMSTTKTYLHLAGVVFATKRPRSNSVSSAVELSTNLSEPQMI
jgi:hypothetical protein